MPNKKEICITNETVLSSCLYVVVHAQNISTISLLRSAWVWLPFDFYINSQTSFDNWLLYITPAFLCLLTWLFFQLSVSFGRDSQSSKLWGDLSHFHKQIYILYNFWLDCSSFHGGLSLCTSVLQQCIQILKNGMTRRLIWKVNQKAKRAILNPPVCMEFNHTHFPLCIKFHGYSQNQKKCPFFTEQKSLFKKFFLIKVCFKLCTPFIWWRIL